MQTQQGLLDRLEIEVRDLMELVRQQLAPLDQQMLQIKPDSESWNTLECLAHLNSYCLHYIPEFEKSIHRALAREFTPQLEFKSTWIGKWAVASVDPDAEKEKKSKASKKHNFIDASLSKIEVKTFLVNQERILRTIEKARHVDLTKAKVKVEVFPVAKMNLGDFLEFIVAHERRHIRQAMQCVEQQVATSR